MQTQDAADGYLYPVILCTKSSQLTSTHSLSYLLDSFKISASPYTMSYGSSTPAQYGRDSGHASGSPAPMLPGAPRVNTVSLPHPNSSPHDGSAGQYDLPVGAPRILALNPLLSYASVPPIYFNVLHDVRSIRLRNGCPPSSLQQPALNQPVTCIRIRFANHPFGSIEVSNPHGVTVLDVLLKIREALHRGVSPQEATISHTVSEYFRARTRADPSEYAQGVKRVDFLGSNVFFAGLSPSMDGQNRWDAHFVPTA